MGFVIGSLLVHKLVTNLCQLFLQMRKSRNRKNKRAKMKEIRTEN